MTRYKSPGKFRDVAEFREAWRQLDPEVDCDLEIDAHGPLAMPLAVGDLLIGNRFAIHPMEGWDGTPEGLPSEHTLRRWARFGQSGAKLIWGGEAFAVREDGRANPNQLFLNPDVDVKTGLAQLRQATHEAHRESMGDTDGLVIGLQLTHSGRYARPHDSTLKPMRAVANPVLDARFSIAPDVPTISDSDLEHIRDLYVDAAALAQDVGFDFVDVKCCHGYLLHELLGAKTRPGRYGGSFENRTRLFTEIIERIRDRCPGLSIGVRVSITDMFPHTAEEGSGVGSPVGLDDESGYPYMFGVDDTSLMTPDLTEPIRFLKMLEVMDIFLVNLSIGSPYYCPHVQRPAAYPPSDGYLPPEDPLRSVIRHLKVARMCDDACPDLAFVGSGYSYLQEYLPYVAQHEVRKGYVGLVGLGRMVLSYPDLPADVLAGRPLQTKKVCRTFSDCTTAPRHGMLSGCYPLDPYYRGREEAHQVRILAKQTRSGLKRD